jgi:hypothetical protein
MQRFDSASQPERDDGGLLHVIVDVIFVLPFSYSHTVLIFLLLKIQHTIV